VNHQIVTGPQILDGDHMAVRKKDYTSKDIRVLNEIEHIQLNCGMYIGDTNNPVHLIEEVLDNALDEALAGHAKIIAVSINTKENIFAVLDNGRGIPTSDNTPITVSSKLFSGAKFQDKKTAYEICCLHGDTELFLLDGSSINIREMAKYPDKEYWGLSVDKQGKFVASKLIAPQITGYTTKMVKVTLDNEKYEIVTPEHLFMLRDGTYKEAINLTEADSLMPCYYKEHNGYIVMRPNYTYEYERNLKLEYRKYIPLHKIVYESVYGEIPPFHCAHHIDLNKKNNHPSNYKLLHNFNEHLPEHTKINSINGTTYTDSLVKYNKSDRGRQKSRENGLLFGTKNLREYVNSNENREDKRNWMTEYNKSVPQLYLQKCKVLKHCKNLLNQGIEINEENWKLNKPKRTSSFKRAISYFESVETLILESKAYNHSIVKIEIINYDTETPVYDVHVPNYSNFVLRSGSVVHNSGLHGVGLVAVNALSEYYKLEIYRDNKYAQYVFEDAKLKYSKISEHTGECPFSTKIEFKPSKKYFESLKPDISRIRQRLTTASAEMPNDISFVLQIDDKQEVFNLTMDRLFIQECFTETDTKKILVHTLSSVCKPESFQAFLAYEEEASVAPRIISSVNLLPVKEGGSHVLFLFDLLKDFFKVKAKKFGFSFQPNDCLYGLRSYISLKLVEPKFSSQTKDKLTNRKDYFMKFEKDITDWLEQISEETVKDYLERFQEYRRKLDSKKLVVNGGGKRASTQFTKLRDCTSRNGILFVVEGESAGGCLEENTEILLENGNKLKIKDLVENIGKEKYKVVCFNEQLNKTIDEVVNGEITKYTNVLIEIVFEDDTKILCTPEHKFRLSNGKYKEAQYLEGEDDILFLPR
jgi:DNA gyrase/topoisomerase IV subunit B